MDGFYFTLHPIHWVFEHDSTQVFRAVRLSGGNYLVSWKSKDRGVSELIFDKEDVFQGIAEGDWKVLDEEIKL